MFKMILSALVALGCSAAFAQGGPAAGGAAETPPPATNNEMQKPASPPAGEAAAPKHMGKKMGNMKKSKKPKKTEE